MEPNILHHVKIKDKQLKSLIWSNKLSNAWRNYQFEVSRLESKKKFHWSILIAEITILGVFITLYSYANLLWLKIIFINLVVISFLGILVVVIKIINLSKKEIKKDEFIQSNAFTRLLANFNDTWVVSSFIGKWIKGVEHLTHLQDFSIDTEMLIKKRSKLKQERERELLQKTGKELDNLDSKIGKRFSGICLAEVSSYGEYNSISWQKGNLKTKNRKIPFISLNKKTRVKEGLVKVDGIVSIDRLFGVTSKIIDSNRGDVIILKKTKILESFYNYFFKQILREYSGVD